MVRFGFLEPFLVVLQYVPKGFSDTVSVGTFGEILVCVTSQYLHILVTDSD